VNLNGSWKRVQTVKPDKTVRFKGIRVRDDGMLSQNSNREDVQVTMTEKKELKVT
jgi:hypothetical protein